MLFVHNDQSQIGKGHAIFDQAVSPYQQIYISFFMERQLPVQSIEQALVGYGNPIDGSKPGDAQNNNNNMMPNSNGAPADQSSMGGLFPEINTDPLSQ